MDKDANRGGNAWPLVGNPQVSGFLEKSIASKKIAGSYIFFGADGLGKATAARFFAKSLFCSAREKAPCEACPSCRQFKGVEDSEESRLDAGHPDYFLLDVLEDKKNISVEQVRELIRNLNMSSFLNSYKIGVIKHVERLSTEAANALLKTLEEPKSKTVTIMLTSDLSAIPKTIVSRSQVVNFLPVSSDLIYSYLADELSVPRGEAKNIARLAAGRPALALKFFQEADYLRDHLEKAEAFLDLFPLDINGRTERVKNLCEESSGQAAAAESSLALFDIWRSVLRDMLLSFFGNKDLVRHEILKDKIEKSLKYAGAGRMFNLDESLRSGAEKIGANVSPRLVLENFIYNM